MKMDLTLFGGRGGGSGLSGGGNSGGSESGSAGGGNVGGTTYTAEQLAALGGKESNIISNKYGTFDRQYADGTLGYTKSNDSYTAEETNEFAGLMDNVIINEATNSIKDTDGKPMKRANMELRGTGKGEEPLLTTWNANGSKSFYRLDLKGTRHTSVRPNGSTRSYMTDTQIKFKHAGSKW